MSHGLVGGLAGSETTEVGCRMHCWTVTAWGSAHGGSGNGLQIVVVGQSYWDTTDIIFHVDLQR